MGRTLLSVAFDSAFKKRNHWAGKSLSLKNLSSEPINIHAVAEPTRKRRGEAAEAAFLARATHLGFTVCLPSGDSERYDSVVDMGRRFLRVQVKSATGYAEHRYRVKTAGASGVPYTPAEIDFFVAYIVPEDIWYIIPIAAIGRRKGAPLLSQCPPPLSRPIRKIARGLVSLGVPTPSPRLARHPSNMPPQNPPRPLRSLPRPVAIQAVRACTLLPPDETIIPLERIWP